MKQLSLGVRLADRATFESFLTADNALALDWLQGLVAEGGQGAGFLHGPTGSGKSHLLQAACARLTGSGYFPLAQLAGFGPDLLDGAEQLSCVCIDDLQIVAGEARWERALFRLYTEIDALQGRLLLAADAPPTALPWNLRDLASRLAVANPLLLRPLDEPRQREALRLRAQLRGLELPEETALYLQRRFPRDMASLLGVLDRLDSAALTAQRRLSVPFIREVLADELP